MIQRWRALALQSQRWLIALPPWASIADITTQIPVIDRLQPLRHRALSASSPIAA
jgi:hypothetical protein